MKKNNNKGNVIIIVLITVFAVILLAFVGFYVLYSSALKPVQSESEEYIYTVETGSRAKTVAEELADAGVIKNGTFAYIYTRLSGKTDVKAGNYALDKSWTVKEIFTVLNDPSGAISDEVMITFQEGKWASEMASTISKKTGCAKKDLLDLWNDTEYIKSIMDEYPFLTEEVLNEELTVKLEGYLFPETYSIRKSASAKQVTKIFLDQMEKIYEKYKDEIEKSDFTFHEVLTLASIVQYESGKESDNAAIAQIFINRLNNPEETGGKLQSNVTAQYAWGTRSVNTEFDENKLIDSPYNTYVCVGLPIGPVCCPGENAIEAVLNPDTNYIGYYYFLSEKNGTMHYAKTYAEHMKNDAKY